MKRQQLQRRRRVLKPTIDGCCCLSWGHVQVDRKTMVRGNLNVSSTSFPSFPSTLQANAHVLDHRLQKQTNKQATLNRLVSCPIFLRFFLLHSQLPSFISVVAALLFFILDFHWICCCLSALKDSRQSTNPLSHFFLSLHFLLLSSLSSLTNSLPPFPSLHYYARWSAHTSPIHPLPPSLLFPFF